MTRPTPPSLIIGRRVSPISSRTPLSRSIPVSPIALVLVGPYIMNSPYIVIRERINIMVLVGSDTGEQVVVGGHSSSATGTTWIGWVLP